MAGRAFLDRDRRQLDVWLVEELLPPAAPLQPTLHGGCTDGGPHAHRGVPVRLAIDERAEVGRQAVVVVRLTTAGPGDDLPGRRASLGVERVLLGERTQALHDLHDQAAACQIRYSVA